MSILEKVNGIVLDKVYTVKELDDKMENLNFCSELDTIKELRRTGKEIITVDYYNLTTKTTVTLDITVVNRILVKVTDVY